MTKRLLFLLILVFNTVVGYSQSDPHELFATANTSFEAGDYNNAIKNYNSILDQKVYSPELFLNLGNAYYNNGGLAQAILHYEKGLKNFPDHASISEKLAAANEEVETEILEVEDFALLRFWRAFTQLFGSTLWAILQFLCLGLVLFGLLQWLLKPDHLIRRKGFMMVMVGLALFVLTFAAGQSAYKYRVNQDEAILMQRISLMQSADAKSPVIEELSSGVKVKIIDQIDEWYKVQLLNHEQGWIATSSLKII